MEIIMVQSAAALLISFSELYHCMWFIKLCINVETRNAMLITIIKLKFYAMNRVNWWNFLEN